MDLLIAPYTVAKGRADTAPVTGTPGWATDGNPGTNTPATQWPAYAFNGIQEELMTLVSRAGLDPDRFDNTQVAKAVESLGAKALAEVGLGVSDTDAMIADMDSITVPSGLYYVNESATLNNWLGGSGFVLHRLYGAGGFQLGQSFSNSMLKFRVRSSGLWGEEITLANCDSPEFTGEPTAPTPAAGDDTGRLATTAFVHNAAQAVAVPPGFVLPFAAVTPPAGWLRANGAAVSRTTYAALFAAIGTTYGAGDGSSTFNLPDARGEFPRFWDDGRGIDANPSPRAIGSTQLGTALAFDIGSAPSIVVSRVAGLSGLQSRAALGVDSGVVSDYNAAVGYYSASSTGSGGLPETAEINWGVTRPRNIAFLGCIKY